MCGETPLKKQFFFLKENVVGCLPFPQSKSQGNSVCM